MVDLGLLADQVSQQDAVEWIGLLTGIVYVLLATYEKPACWIFGILSSVCIAWKSFTDYLLIADTFLQIFYVGMGVYGLLVWYSGAERTSTKKIITTAFMKHLVVIVGGAFLSLPLSWVMVHYADARYGYPDTLLTLLSVWATILLIRKDLHNWVYWVCIDIVYVVLYWKTDGLLFSLLFLLYTLIAIWGYLRWSKALKDEKIYS